MSDELRMSISVYPSGGGGVEIDEQYCALLANRLSQGTFDFGPPIDETRASGWSGAELDFGVPA